MGLRADGGRGPSGGEDEARRRRSRTAASRSTTTTSPRSPRSRRATGCQGPAVDEFEARLCGDHRRPPRRRLLERHRGGHAACFTAGLVPGDRVGPALTFRGERGLPATYVGPPRWCSTSTHAEPRPDAVPADLEALVAVHYAGPPVDLERLAARPRCRHRGRRPPSAPGRRRAGRQLRPQRPVLLLVPPGEGRDHRRGWRGHHQRRRLPPPAPVRRHGVVALPDLGGWAYEIAGGATTCASPDIAAAAWHEPAGQARASSPAATTSPSYCDLLADLP